MIDLTREEAVALYNSGFWETMSSEERAKFQMLNERLCMPFDVFSEAMSKYLGRPVYTHEFTSSNHDSLMKEVFDGAPPPTLDEIINLIPKEKRVILGVSK
jgi:hypothetical protein